MTLSKCVGYIAAALILAAPALAYGDQEEQSEPKRPPAAAARKPIDQSSANFNKTRQFLPGEEVITPTGRTMKVWSSNGPVQVSRPPEPFEDREKSVLDGSHIVIDAEQAPLIVPDDRRPDHRRYERRPKAGE